ncbi:MAG: hypothetical protein QM722_19585 [Piscinibacter sp.]
MSIRRTLIAAALAACSLSSVHAAAGAKLNIDRTKTDAPSAAAQAAEAVATAQALARYGDANKDALSLITAARILKETGARESLKVSKGSEQAAKRSDDSLSADAVLERGRALATGRPELLALADDVAKSGSRGVDRGPQIGRNKVVGTRAWHHYDLRFVGGERAKVYVRGDGDSDLDLYVYDESGNLICKDESRGDEMTCTWTPRWTGMFRIRVLNRGIVNQYSIVTN